LAWITKVDIKKILETESAKHDDLIDALILFVESAFKTLSNNLIDSATLTEKIKVTNGNEIVLSRCPVTAIVDLDITEGDYTQDIDSDDYIVYKNGVIKFDCRFTGTVKIEYTAGYSTVPEDIKTAVILQVMVLLKKKSRLGLASLGKRGEATSFIRERYVHQDKPWLPDFLAVVELYKNPVENMETV